MAELWNNGAIAKNKRLLTFLFSNKNVNEIIIKDTEIVWRIPVYE